MKNNPCVLQLEKDPTKQRRHGTAKTKTDKNLNKEWTIYREALAQSPQLHFYFPIFLISAASCMVGM